MKKLYFITFLLTVFAFSLQAAGQKTFTVGFDANFPPYGYRENGEYKGFDLDLAREVARRNGWKFIPKPISWEAKDSELNSGMIDCIWNGFTINGRENLYTWSDPYVINEQIVMVVADSPVKKLKDLRGRKVAVQTDTPVYKALSPKGERSDLGKIFASLVVVSDYNSAVMMLESGGVDAVAMDIGVAKSKLKAGNFRILDEILMSEYYGIGFRKGDTGLRDIVQKTLIAMSEDGTAGDISARYFDGDRSKMALGEIIKIDRQDIPRQTEAIGDESFDMSWIKELLRGLSISVAIFVLTIIFAFPLGLLVALGRMSKIFIVRNVFKLYISVMRGTPLMLQLLLWGYGPYYIFGLNLSDLSVASLDYYYIAVILGFSFNYAAYFAEIYRAGFESIPRGQYEAAAVLGYSPVQCFIRIIMPQVVKRILPPITNEVITLVKDTSLAFSLSVLEMFTIAKQISSAQASMMPLIVAGVFYYFFNYFVAEIMAFFEKKMNYYR